VCGWKGRHRYGLCEGRLEGEVWCVVARCVWRDRLVYVNKTGMACVCRREAANW